MYVGAREDWPGQYLPGVGFGVVGIAACLLLTLMPSRRNKPATAPEPDPTSLES
jgi:UDP-GlcNAc:undecaprenyl-phosphate GlcNAc-1-phosphate transferase